MRKEQIGEGIPRRIKVARAMADMTTADLAAAANLSRHQVWRFERGEQIPNAVELAQIAEATGQTLAFFLEEAAA